MSACSPRGLGRSRQKFKQLHLTKIKTYHRIRHRIEPAAWCLINNNVMLLTTDSCGDMVICTLLDTDYSDECYQLATVAQCLQHLMVTPLTTCKSCSGGWKCTRISNLWAKSLVRGNTKWLKDVGYGWSPRVGYDWSPRVGCDWSPRVGFDWSKRVGYDWSPRVGYDWSPRVGFDWSKRVGCDWSPRVGFDWSLRSSIPGVKMIPLPPYKAPQTQSRLPSPAKTGYSDF